MAKEVRKADRNERVKREKKGIHEWDERGDG